MQNAPFYYRVAILLALMTVVAAFDRWRNREKATRWQEYTFIVCCGVLGSAVGVVNDWITSSISPEYFTLGKDLDGENIRAQAAILGLKTGFSGGVIAGAVSLFASGKSHPWRDFYVRLWIPVAGAVLLAVLFPLCFSSFDPTRLSNQLKGIISLEQALQFRRVWWIHTGIYAGMAVGVGSLIFQLRRKSASAPPPSLGE